jgi:hypothetical protein
MEAQKICLFEDYENQPKELKAICDKYMEKYANGKMNYKKTAKFLKKVEKIGYTFDAGLDNEPYGLRLIGTELNELQGFEEM